MVGDRRCVLSDSRPDTNLSSCPRIYSIQLHEIKHSACQSGLLTDNKLDGVDDIRRVA